MSFNCILECLTLEVPCPLPEVSFKFAIFISQIHLRSQYAVWFKGDETYIRHMSAGYLPILKSRSCAREYCAYLYVFSVYNSNCYSY